MFTPAKGSVGPDDFVYGDQEAEDEEPKGVKGLTEKFEIGVKSKIKKGGKDAKKLEVKSTPKVKVVEKITGKKTGAKESKTGGCHIPDVGARLKPKNQDCNRLKNMRRGNWRKEKMQGKTGPVVKKQRRRVEKWMSQ